MTKHFRRLRWALLVAPWASLWAPLWLAPAHAQAPARPAQEAIGAWVIACPPAQRDPCIMRHRDWILPPGSGGPSAALEVQARGNAFVPVVALRGLSPSAAAGTALALQPVVTLALDNGPRFVLNCGLSGTYLACAPDASAIPAMAEALPTARSVSASASLSLPGAPALPPREVALALSGTQAALVRLRALGPTGEAMPTYPGLDLSGLVDRLLRGTDGAAPRFLRSIGF